MTIGIFILGLIIGGIVTWLIANSRLQGRARVAEAIVDEKTQQIQQKESEISQIRGELNSERASKIEAITRLEASQKNLDEQRSLLEKMGREMKDAFNALSKSALESSNESFLKLASERLGKIAADTEGKLGEHKATMNGLVKPLEEALKKYEEHIHGIEVKRKQEYTSLDEHIKMLAATHQQLQKETNSLVTALRKPQVSGSWGQLSLKRAAELAGMTAYCDFYEQVSVDTETGRLRPDMIVRLPNGREIVVDAKAPVDAYLNAISMTTDEEREKALNNYVSQVRAHMNALGSKSYWDQFPKSPEIVVMYLPGESFFSAALEHDHTLIEDSSSKKVILATPTTFIALLKAIAYGWQQEQLTKNAQEISILGKELYERISIMLGHFDDMGSAIEKTISAYNKTVGSLESRVLPSARRFKELGIAGSEEIPILEQIDQTPRTISLSD